MSDNLTDFAFGIGLLLAVFVALAAAAEFLKGSPSTVKRLPAGILHTRIARTVVWLAFTAALTMPLADSLAFLHSMPQVFSPSAWTSQVIAAATPWGTAPWPLYLVLTDLLLIGSYVMAFASMWGHVNGGPSPRGERRRPRWQSAYLIAVAGSLLYHFLRATILQVMWLQIPVALPPTLKGLAGFSLGWAVAILFLLVAVALFPNPLSEVAEDANAA